MAKAEPDVDGVAIRRRPRSSQIGKPKARRRLVHPELAGKNETLNRMHARWVDPADVLVITDRDHPRYDPRGELKVPQTMVDSLATYGCIEPVIACRNGGTLEICDGRMRVLGLRRVNEDRRRAGRWPLRLPVVLRACENDGEALAVAATTNNVRFDDTVHQRALKAAGLVKAGLSQREVATAMGMHEAAISMYMAITRLVPELQEMSAAGRVSLKEAQVVARLPREQQLEAFAKIERERSSGSSPTGSESDAQGGERSPEGNGSNGTPQSSKRAAGPAYYGRDRLRALVLFVVETDPGALPASTAVLLLWLTHDPATTEAHVVRVFPRLAPLLTPAT